MRNSLTQKGNSSLLSESPFSYVTESVTESPLLISNSGFGCSYGIHPLADCVKSALTLLLGIKNLCSSFWRSTVLTWGVSFFINSLFYFLRPSLSLRGCVENRSRSTARAVSYITSRALLLLENNQNLLLERNEMRLFFNRKVCDKQVR